MSHNIEKINGKKQEPSGNITVSVGDLDGIGSVSSGQLLKYNETLGVWDGIDEPTGGVSGFDFALFGQGELDDYANSGFGTTVGDTWGFYDSNPENNIASSVTFNYVPGTSWLENITFQPGTYEIFVQCDAAFSASGYVGVRLHDELDNAISTYNLSGAAQPSSYGHVSTINSTHTFTETKTIRTRLTLAFNLAAAQGTVPSSRGVILIRKVA
jgi:hypothetical protein